MSHINVEAKNSTQTVDITHDPIFLQNRAVAARGERMAANPDLPQVVRDDARNAVMRHAMDNIRRFDPLFKPNEVAEKALESGYEELLLEASNADAVDVEDRSRSLQDIAT